MSNLKKFVCLPFLLFPLLHFSQNIDSLLMVLSNEKSDTQRVEQLVNLANLHNDININEAFKYAWRAVNLAQELQQEKWLGNSYLVLGRTCANGEKPDSAQIYFEKALTNFELINDQKGVASVYGKFVFMENVFNRNFEKALDYGFKALNIFEKLEYTTGILETYNDLANILSYQLKTKESNIWAYKAKELAKKLDNEPEYAFTLEIIGTNYLIDEQYDSSLNIINEIIGIYEKYNSQIELALKYNDKGNAHRMLGNVEAALDAYNTSLELAEASNYVNILGTLHGNFGQVFFLKKEYRKAIQELEKSIAFFYQHKQRNNLVEYLERLSNAYETVGDYEKALETHQMFKATQDSIFDEESEKIVADLNVKYETEQSQKKIIQLENEKLVQATQIQQQRNQNIMIGGGAFLLLLLAGFLYYRFRYVSQIKEKLTRLDTTKNRLFAILSHDLRSSVTGFQNVGSIVNFHIKKGNYDRLKTVGESVVKSANNLHNLLDNILHWSVSQLEGVEMNPEKVSIAPAVEEIIELYSENAKAKGISIQSNIASDLQAFVDPNSLKLILRNLVSNALKFSAEGDEIKLQGNSKNGHIKITVADTGLGIPSEKIENIFKIDSKTSSKGTSGEQGAGLGLALCKEFIEKNKGQIFIDSKLNQGTKISFELPKA